MLNRRHFTTALLAIPAAPFLCAQNDLLRRHVNAQGTPGSTAGFTGNSFKDLPEGFGPKELGERVANRFASAPHPNQKRIIYQEVCAWWGSLQFATLTRNNTLTAELQQRFEPLFTTEHALLPPQGQHVDFSMFGSLPLELYLLGKDERYLRLGLSYANAQWSMPNTSGLTEETRFWVDDMWMITILQVQAFRCTGDKKYLDRAALTMAAYLDKLQQPNGLFFHALDVHYYWGRGNGWFAAGMAELLSELPESHPQHARILKGYRVMMTALVDFQTPSGCWRQLIDRPESFDESSGTGMFTFALITGTQRGWLERSTFFAPARRAWISLAGFVDQHADITACCEGTNKFDSLDYYLLRRRKTGDLHGQAAFLWAVNAALRASPA